MSAIAAMILAGGPAHRAEGVARALIPVRGVPLVGRTLSLTGRFEPGHVVVVAGEGYEAIRGWIGGRAETIRQERPYGSAHAASLALERLTDADDLLLVLYADRPLLTEATVRRLLDAARSTGAAAAILSVHVDRPAGFARIVRDGEGNVIRCTGDCELARAEDSGIREVVAGAYWFHTPALRRVLPPSAVFREKRNLTECVQALVDSGLRAIALPVSDPQEAFAAYSIEDARRAETRFWARLGPPGEKC